MRKLLVLTAVAMLAAAPAKASSFDYSSYSVTNQQNISFTSPVAETGGAGMITLVGTGPQAGIDITAWCVDLFDFLQTSSVYNIVPLTTAGSGGLNPALTPAQIGEIGSLMIHGAADVPVDPDFNASAAFQLAIWSIEYPTNLIDNASGPLATLVTALVARVETGDWQCPTCTVDLLDAPVGNQVLAFGVSPTPLPGAVWLFGTGLFGLGMLGRRKKRAVSVI
jgi:hypothetical protein